MAVEQEVKLKFDDYEAARQAVITAGGRLVRSVRAQDDLYLDTAAGQLESSRSALRIRREPHAATLTFKGPLHSGPVKSREEIETTASDADALESILGRLGYHEQFRLGKQREDYELGSAHVFIDQTPVGVFVEIEAGPDVIESTAAALGKTPADYVLSSYRTLYRANTQP